MSKKVIFVVDRSQARIYRSQPFEALQILNNPKGREKNRAFTTDHPGWSRGKFSRASSPHLLTGGKDPHEEAAIEFGRLVAHYIERHLKARDFAEVEVVCEPKMMGRILAFIPEKLRPSCRWLQKDLSHLQDHQLAEVLGS